MISLGWPFLIGRGRRAGHRVLLAPDFLVAADDHGVLEGIAGNTVIKLGPLTVRSVTHQVEAQDVHATERPRDEHGRPLRLIYGVIAKGTEPANADLPTALAAALATYRRFLNAEDEFSVESSQGFPLRTQPSTVDPLPRSPQPGRPARARVATLSASTALVAILAVGSTILLGQSAREPAPTTPPPAPPTSSAPPPCPSNKIIPTTDQAKVVCDGATSTTVRKP
jgi:hypothetical protein